MSKSDAIRVDDIKAAQSVIAPYIRKTSLNLTTQLAEFAGKDSKTFLKYENRQRTGSFKIRGALNKLASLSEDEKRRGVVASSAGNHAQGVAYSSTQLGVQSHIVMPATAPLVKIQATQGYGANVILAGDIYDEAYAHARKLEKEKGYVFVHPFEDPKIIAGQGTIGLEILDQMSEVDCVLVCVGGGGLISGIATAIKSINPNCRVIGVQAQAAPAMAETFKQKKIVEIQPSSSTLADGVAVKTPSEFMYKTYISQLIDDLVTVNDEEIAQAIAFLMERTKTVVEGAGALAVAAVMQNKVKLGKNNVLILSGGNIDLNIVSKVIEQGLKKAGRRVQLSVLAQDVPGTLERLTHIIANNNANILEVVHDRSSSDLFLRETKIHFVLETTNQKQIDEIRNHICDFGCRII